MLINILGMADGDPDISGSESSDDSFSDSEDTDNDFDDQMSSDVSEEDINLNEDADEGDCDEEDELVSAIENRKEISPTKPPSIKGDDLFTGLSFHPSRNTIAMSCLNGNVELYSYSIEENVLKGTIEAHVKSCRSVEFSPDGNVLYSIGRDKNIVFSDVETLDMKMFIDSAHHVAMTALCVPDENILCTGDEEGVIKVWDPRYTRTSVFKAHDAHDYISCITSKDSQKIACSSGDGTLISYDLRTNKKLQESAPSETDLTCCTSTHNETMIVCGTLAGQFLFYKWNDFSDVAGTFKTSQKVSINSVLQISDNIILAGMEDGHIRAFHFFPHKEIGIVGQHTLNIEHLDISHDGTLVASLSPDPVVKFWNISYLEGFVVTEVEKSNTKSGVNLPSSEFDDRKSFFSDLS